MHGRLKNILFFCGGVCTVFVIIGGMFFFWRHLSISQAHVIQKVVAKDPFHSDERKELFIGATGGDVVDVNARLIFHGIAPAETFVDEQYFGEKTQYHVMLFQLMYDIVPTGVVDQETWNALLSREKSEKTQYQHVPIDPGYDNAEVFFPAYFAKAAYLTFNVRGNGQQVKKILPLLEKYHAHATFFFSQDIVRDHPEIIKSVFDKGHGMGVLLDDRWDFVHMTYAEISTEMSHFSQDISAITGRTPWCARPTYSMLMSAAQVKLAQQTLGMMYWDVDPQNQHVSPDTVVQHVLAYTQPGETVLFHVGDTQTDDEALLIALKQIITRMQNDAWELRALSCM